MSVAAGARQRHSRRAQRLLLAGTAALVGITTVGVLVLLHSFNAEGARPNTKVANVGINPDLTIEATVLSVDPTKQQMSLRLLLNPVFAKGAPAENANGGLEDAGGHLVDDLHVFVRGSGDQVVPKGTFFFDAPIDATVNLKGTSPTATNARETVYPFDKYRADLYIECSLGTPGTTLVTHNLIFRYAVHGFRIDIVSYNTGLTHGGSGNTDLTLGVRRSSSTLAFVIFVMVLMWLLTIAIVAMAVILTMLRHDIGPGVLGFLAAVLFAFPGIRNVLPGAPPLGSLNDYLSFFWCEGIVAITLVVLTVLYLTREARPQLKWAAGIADVPLSKRADRLAQLRDLASMREQGVVTADEFESEKQRILDEP